jgi:putative glutamine amidotransferase
MPQNETPLIGLFGWKTGDNSFGSSIAYMEYLGGFGNVRIISPEEPVDERIDLIVVPGGADVDPGRYNAIPHFYTSKPDPIKEYMDTQILPEYIALGISVLGICRGCQSLAVLYGAKLIQHMFHETNDKTRFDTVHDIELVPSTFKTEYERANGKGRIKVNSMHHQCVSTYNFPDHTLEILGVYSGKKNPNIEVFRHRRLPIYGLQYHPEELYDDPLGDYIVAELLQRSKNNEVEQFIQVEIKEN